MPAHTLAVCPAITVTKLAATRRESQAKPSRPAVLLPIGDGVSFVQKLG